MKKKDYYIYVPYRKEYPILFNLEKENLKKILKIHLKNFKIVHIGSTSVRGLGGKGIIDIIIIVNKKDMLKAKNILMKNKYKIDSKYDNDVRYFLRKKVFKNKSKKEFNISITHKNSWLYKDAVATRDYLIKHKNTMDKYAKIKKEGVKLSKGDGNIYRNYKDPFLKEILKRLN